MTIREEVTTAAQKFAADYDAYTKAAHDPADPSELGLKPLYETLQGSARALALLLRFLPGGDLGFATKSVLYGGASSGYLPIEVIDPTLNLDEVAR
jgi:hypothetical protein